MLIRTLVQLLSKIKGFQIHKKSIVLRKIRVCRVGRVMYAACLQRNVCFQISSPNRSLCTENFPTGSLWKKKILVNIFYPRVNIMNAQNRTNFLDLSVQKRFLNGGASTEGVNKAISHTKYWCIRVNEGLILYNIICTTNRHMDSSEK